jgi:D-glycero-D-manno-heptose 1,7-bisphosphate phosphatase
MMDKAIFLDRDGVINELVYYSEQGIIDSPFIAQQFCLLPYVGEALKILREKGFKLILVSNQPGIAKGHLNAEAFQKIRTKMIEDLAHEGASLDSDYYCFHHPESKIVEFRINCNCRKPEPGLILKAANEMYIDLATSWMIGDGLTDIQAGKEAGCKTILIGKMKCELCSFMKEMDAKPDMVASNLVEAAKYISSHIF